jgi:hypothetical protein
MQDSLYRAINSITGYFRQALHNGPITHATSLGHASGWDPFLIRDCNQNIREGGISVEV